MSEIKAIIFDCFGVLTTDGWLPFKEQHFTRGSEQWLQASDLNKQLDSGLIGYAQFTLEVARLAGVDHAVARRAIDDNVTNEPLFNYIERDIKSKYKLGILSNAGANWLPELFTPDQLNLFDAVVLSYEIGVIKPDPRSYQAIAAKLGVELDGCVFVDDQERFCTGAKEVGMVALVYSTLDQLKTDLRTQGLA